MSKVKEWFNKKLHRKKTTTTTQRSGKEKPTVSKPSNTYDSDASPMVHKSGNAVVKEKKVETKPHDEERDRPSLDKGTKTTAAPSLPPRPEATTGAQTTGVPQTATRLPTTGAQTTGVPQMATGALATTGVPQVASAEGGRQPQQGGVPLASNVQQQQPGMPQQYRMDEQPYTGQGPYVFVEKIPYGRWSERDMPMSGVETRRYEIPVEELRSFGIPEDVISPTYATGTQQELQPALQQTFAKTAIPEERVLISEKSIITNQYYRGAPTGQPMPPNEPLQYRRRV